MPQIKTLLIVILVLFIGCTGTFSSVNAQSIEPYELDWKKEAPILATGTFTQLTFFILHRKSEPLTEQQIAALDPLKVPTFDRYSLNHYSTKAAKLSDILLYTAPLVPLSLLADKPVRENLGTTMAIYGETMLLTSGITALTKQLASRTRPYAYMSEVPLDKKQHLDTKMSFFSGHTSSAAASYFLFAKTYHDYHPNSDWKPVVWASSATVPALMAYLRCRGGKHFPSDVIVGYIVGAAIGILVPEIHKVKN